MKTTDIPKKIKELEKEIRVLEMKLLDPDLTKYEKGEIREVLRGRRKDLCYYEMTKLFIDADDLF